MVGVLYHNNNCRFNVMMSSGTHGTIAYKKKLEIKMRKLEPVAKIAVFQREEYGSLSGFRFYAKTGEVLLEVGYCSHS